MSYNKITLMGRLGADPDSRAFPDGGVMTRLRVATTATWKDRQSGERQERTEWHSVIFRGGQAEVIQQYFHKGDQILVDGELRYRKYEQDGVEKWVAEIYASTFSFVGSRQDSAGSSPGATAGQYQAARQGSQAPQPASSSAGPDYGAGYMDDDIPFMRLDSRIY